jgi:hypothetical protein
VKDPAEHRRYPRRDYERQSLWFVAVIAVLFLFGLGIYILSAYQQ